MSDVRDMNKHRIAMYGLIDAFNNAPNNEYVLKGGTSLMRCYGLDRFSEDVDLDAPFTAAGRNGFFDAVDTFCKANELDYRVGKDTETVKRAFIHYLGPDNPAVLKVEASYRRRDIPMSLLRTINNVLVYSLDEICMQKCSAYMSRDKLRDLYDVTWLCTERYNELGRPARDALLHALEYKDLDQFDYIARTQSDPLVDIDALETRFLRSFEIVGLMSPNSTAITEDDEATLSPNAPQFKITSMHIPGNAIGTTSSRHRL